MNNQDLKRFYPDYGQTESKDFVRLDSYGKITSKVLPSYVDDVIEGYYYNGAFYEDVSHTKLLIGEEGKIYLDLSSNISYRYNKTNQVYIRIGGLVLEQLSVSDSEEAINIFKSETTFETGIYHFIISCNDTNHKIIANVDVTKGLNSSFRAKNIGETTIYVDCDVYIDEDNLLNIDLTNLGGNETSLVGVTVNYYQYI